jgi:hypothetical protein
MKRESNFSAEKLRERANRPVELPHSLVIYQIPPKPMPMTAGAVPQPVSLVGKQPGE